MKHEIYIGDNLEVLNSQPFSKYKEKVKLIYIDPPYNTKTTKSYNDKVHSEDWKDFMRPRLVKAKDFLLQDGVIFISIDDNEYANLKTMCDEVFGESNYLGTFITKQSQRSNAKHINTVHEYILAYGKDKKKVSKFQIKRVNIPSDKIMIDRLSSEAKRLVEDYDLETANKLFTPIVNNYCSMYSITWLKNYNNIDSEGNIFFAVDLSTPGQPRSVSIPDIGIELDPLKTRSWSSDQMFRRLHKEKRLVFKDKRPYSKKFLSEASDNAQSILNFYSRQGTNDLKKLGLSGLFDTPKPVELIKYLIRIVGAEDDVVLDFFAGSGTTAQAVYEVNKEDQSNNTYLLIQQPEQIDKSSKVYDYCLKHNIIPSVDHLLEERIKKYLKINKKEKDYKIIKKKLRVFANG